MAGIAVKADKNIHNLAYVFSKHTALHAHGLWWSFPVTNIAVGIVSIRWFARGSWKNGRLTEDDRQVVKITQEAIIEDGVH